MEENEREAKAGNLSKLKTPRTAKFSVGRRKSFSLKSFGFHSLIDCKSFPVGKALGMLAKFCHNLVVFIQN